MLTLIKYAGKDLPKTYTAINKPKKEDINEDDIKRLIIDTFGTDGTVKLTPETLDSNASLRELGATQDNINELAAALDLKYNLGNADAKRSPYGWHIPPLDHYQHGFFLNLDHMDDDGVDIDTVNKIKTALLTGKAIGTKNYRKSYDSKDDKLLKLDPNLPYKNLYDEQYELDDHPGYKFLYLEPGQEKDYAGPIKVQQDDAKDAVALGLLDELNKKHFFRSKSSVLNKYLKDKGITTDYDKQDHLIRAIIKEMNGDHMTDYDFYSYDRPPLLNLLVDEMSKLPINKNGMPEVVEYAYNKPTLPFEKKSSLNKELLELPIRNKIDKSKVTDKNIKRLILEALGNKGAKNLKPEDLNGDTSLRELGARYRNMLDLAKLLDQEFKPDGTLYDDYDKMYIPYPYFLQSGIDIDTVNKIKKALLSKSNFVPKGYDNFYDHDYPDYDTLLDTLRENNVKGTMPFSYGVFDDSYYNDYVDKLGLQEDADEKYKDLWVPNDIVSGEETTNLLNILNNNKSDKAQLNILQKYIKDKGLDDQGLINLLGALALRLNEELALGLNDTGNYSHSVNRLLFDKLNTDNDLTDIYVGNQAARPSFVTDDEQEDYHTKWNLTYE